MKCYCVGRKCNNTNRNIHAATNNENDLNYKDNRTIIVMTIMMIITIKIVILL